MFDVIEDSRHQFDSVIVVGIRGGQDCSGAKAESVAQEPNGSYAKGLASVKKKDRQPSHLAIAEFSANHFIRFHNLIPLWGLNPLFTEARSLLRSIHEGVNDV